MSSSQSNSNTNQAHAAAFDEYDTGETTWSTFDYSFNNPNQSSNLIEPYSDELNDDYDEYIESQLEAERNTTYDENEEEIYSDDVQNAFASYEDEFSKYWTQQESAWNGLSRAEQDEMYEQMRECEMFMSQEYTTAEMPHDLVERAQESQLNPDANEFRPSWLATPTTVENQNVVVTSWAPCEAKKQDD